MKLNILTFAIPVFVALMLLEYYAGTRKGKKVFHFDEAVANINAGIAERLGDIFTTGFFYFIFSWIYHHWAVFPIKAGIFSWIFLVLFTDLIWYWYHRFGHEVNILWSAHVVHHQSEDFNFTVSARITVFQSAARCIFWCILPLVGFSPQMTTIMLLVHGAYPFFTHTQLVGRLGFLEYILVTPSHHRVHHSSNPQYLDKNYGDMFIFWDKIFGTYARETEMPVYGLTKPLGSYSFLWQHFHFLLEMAVAYRRAGSAKEKLQILFGRPDVIDPRIRLYLEKKLLQKNTAGKPSASLVQYIRLQTILNLFILFLVVLLVHYQSALQLGIVSVFILLSIINTGAMLEQKQWIFPLECARILLAGAYLYTYMPYQWLALLILSVMTIGTLYYKTFSLRYYAMLYHDPQ